MTQDASHELQVAIVAALKASTEIEALVADRIYDQVPLESSGSLQFPYISFGSTQVLQEQVECFDASDLTIQIDIWSRDPGYAEGRKIAKVIRAVLNEEELSLSDNALVYFKLTRRDDVRASDGVTTHIAMTFGAGVENH
ncbi:DUF3168 domain-containing protein [Agrobacterium vitis]|uniref:DUF3168 domain-containing protein n=1 Tax=Rhizobium/Agrobacterium group TaxID=227290 RepID=UPI0008DC036A|nr:MULTISPECIES: DUF3168 domain-containing protein [Rhizobium/Agrobacterium group]MCF1436830.1 DUF3168 domain-containing protein [Allorhizobium ampelinum]MUO92277.1 DUF3168 domain-containing protein [Agrobacterium vitis]MUZ55098.1 DUF3168 domain-containing protein [Agrobacterium vitis]MUZ94233.1 DUF3168 domain-containing protein [Agrobacterium vitis]MVA42960.1 DUF3168 domain-containing protein [Agrobacterium vitis]